MFWQRRRVSVVGKDGSVLSVIGSDGGVVLVHRARERATTEACICTCSRARHDVLVHVMQRAREDASVFANDGDDASVVANDGDDASVFANDGDVGLR